MRFFTFYPALLSLIVLPAILRGQSTGPQLANIQRPSPNVQAMQKYGDIPVSAYTGVPNISIPLYTVSFRDITLPLSLIYHASGIKVAEEASQVGLGWVLNAGGTISRNILGDDDFNGSVYFNGPGNTATDLSDGQGPLSINEYGCQFYGYNTHGSQTLDTIDLTSYLNASPPIDFQPDQYYYNLPTASGKFILKRNGQAVLQKQEKLNISLLSADGTSWEIKGLDGTTYDFTQYETYQDPSNGQNHMSAWYLTKITSPTGNVVTLQYTTLPSRSIVPEGSYSETRDDYDLPIAYTFPGYSGTLVPHSLPSQKGPTPGKNYSLVILNTIDFNNGVVVFNYSDNRPDLSGDKRLDSLSVYYRDASGNLSTTPFKTVALNYGYFAYGDGDDSYNASPGAANFYERMKLTQAQQKGYFGGALSAEPPYSFTYFENSGFTNLPSKASFARDHWGYYNGKTGHTSLIPSIVPVNSSDLVTYELGVPGPERDPDTSFAKAFTLQTIQYPTGGTTTFDFEGNDFDEQNSQVNDQSYFSKVPSTYDTSALFAYDAVAHQVITGDTLDLRKEYNYSYNPLVPGSTANISVNVAFRFSNSVSCPYSLAPDGVMYIELYDSTGTNLISHIDPADLPACSGSATSNCVICTGSSSPVLSINFSLYLQPGKYVWKGYCSTSNYGANMQDIHATYNWVAERSSNPAYGAVNGSYITYGGGLRIRQIIDHDPVYPGQDKVRRYLYHYWADKNGDGVPEEYSYGRRMAKPEYSYFSASVEILKVQSGGVNYSTTYDGFHLMRNSDSNIPLNGSALGSVVGYDQVTELQGANGENGKTNYQYYNQPDALSSYNDLIAGAVSSIYLPDRPPYASNVADPLNGSLLVQADSVNLGGVYAAVQTKSSTYTTVSTNENKVFGIESRFPVINNWYNGVFQNSTAGTNCNRYLFSYNSLRSEWPCLTATDQKVFNQSNPALFTETSTQYYYDNTAHLLPTRVVTTDSKGETVTTTTHYPLDFSGATATDPTTAGIALLQNDHVINAVVESFTTKKTGGGTNIGVTNGLFTGYSPGAPLANYYYKARLASPSTSFASAATQSGAVAIDPSYEQRVSIDSYDAYGNILQQRKTSGEPHAYVWDYRSSLPVAHAANAASQDVAYTSFEADGTGSWTIPSASRDTGGITGSSCYNMSNGAITRSGLTAANKYVVSFWARTSSSVSVTGGTGAVTGKTIGNWTYHEYTLTGGTTATVTGTGDIDELRLYPSAAQMTTKTYHPLIGITSECDVDNRVTYYQYDGLGRLIVVKDQDGNIIKTYKYHYQGQAN